MIKYLSSILLFVSMSTLAASEDGFVEIFNGKDLSGWTVRNGTATYRVEEVRSSAKLLKVARIPFCVQIKNTVILNLNFRLN